MSSELLHLCEMAPNQSGDFFAVLASREQSQTRDGKPYYRVAFRDAKRSATSMIWSDHGQFPDCSEKWKVGEFYKLRGKYTENSYGPQIEIERIRPVEDADAEQGFSPDDFFEVSRYDREEMFEELISIAQEQITEQPLQRLVVELLTEHADTVKRHAAAARNHHAFMGGYLEHTLSVTRTAVFLADKYGAYYTRMQPPLSKSLVVAGAILHDIGKVEELKFKPEGWEYTPRGRLVGHIFIGRDIVLNKAATIPDINPETVLRLEHIIISHQGLPEWGSPISPSTPEALLVHYADDMDAKFHELAAELEKVAPSEMEFTDYRNPLRRRLFRGLNPDKSNTD
ncbi:MAG: HD domain-containing protein [Planctomycetota bacterium]|nr:HD domain-containing protein [Planctomycetota bacterium]